MNVNRSEAERRVRKAYSLIESAFRLHEVDPVWVVEGVKAAMIEGAQQAADDVREDVEKIR
jgi:hypothetical protein